jgi:hypothetical protein
VQAVFFSARWDRRAPCFRVVGDVGDNDDATGVRCFILL